MSFLDGGGRLDVKMPVKKKLSNITVTRNGKSRDLGAPGSISFWFKVKLWNIETYWIRFKMWLKDKKWLPF
jgi:hypothetical protein